MSDIDSEVKGNSLPPGTVFGLPASELQQIGTIVEGMRPISQRISQDGRILGGLVGLFPLLEKLQAGEEITSASVHDHREDIENIIHPLIDEYLPRNILLRPLGAFGKVTLDLVAEKEFQHVVPFAMKKAEDYVPRAEPYVKVLAGFANPRQQFTEEVIAIDEMVLANIEERSEEAPDAAIAAMSLQEIIFSRLLSNPGEMASELPIFSQFVAIRNTRAKTPKDITLPEMAALAPALLMMLGSLQPANKQRQDLIAAIRENPDTGRVHSINPGDLQAFENSAPVLLPAIRNLIPETGTEIEEKFKEVKAFLA